MRGKQNNWPELSYERWRETGAAFHMWAQIVGKYRLAHAPWVNHSWQATLYVTPRGLTTGPIPDEGRSITVDFDFDEHRLVARAEGGATAGFPLEPMGVADFLARTREVIEAIGGTPKIHGRPNEVPDPVPFAKDTVQRPYDREAMERFHRALLRSHEVLSGFRTSFVGKVSPVHLFWGALDLAVTRFSGRRAPLHPGGFPSLPDEITREAYSHEVSSAGFWAGGNGVDEAMYYSYAYPEPEDFRSATVEPASAYFDETLGEFLLPYEAVRSSDAPEETLSRFVRSTYEAAANAARWDRPALECEPGTPRVPRRVTAD